MNRIKVKPAEGLIIRKPHREGGGLLDPSGELVHDRSYWHRLLKAGDVVSVQEQAPKKVTARSAKTEKKED